MVIESIEQLRENRKHLPLLAIEIRAQRFGFALLCGGDLLDSGVCVFGSDAAAHMRLIRKLAFLLRLYSPGIIIARRTRRAGDESSATARRNLAKICAWLRQRSIPFLILDRQNVADYFGAHDCANKHDIAALVASRFSDLKERVPRRRKPWNPEAYVVIIFDAVATGIAFSDTQVMQTVAPCDQATSPDLCT